MTNHHNIPKKALIIDDQQTISMIYSKVLKDLGIEKVFTAPSASIGLKGYLVELPDLVLLDVNMPIKDGLTLLKEIMSNDPDANVVMLTSVNDRQTVINCLRAGAKNYLLKMDEVSDVKQKLINIMRKLDFSRNEFRSIKAIA